MLVKAEAGQLETGAGPEFETIAGLGGTGVPVAPGPVARRRRAAGSGRPFFVTEWVPGTASTSGRCGGTAAAEEVRAVGLDLARAAARLHTVDWRRRRRRPTSAGRVGRRAAAAQLAYWEDLFRRQRLEPHPALVYAFGWLRRAGRRWPSGSRSSTATCASATCSTTGGRLTALLDWEMVHLGDPVEDLGWVYRRSGARSGRCRSRSSWPRTATAAGRPVDPDHLRWYQAVRRGQALR